MALGWRIDEEGFMSDNDLFDQLKLRAGYGITGNQQGLYPQILFPVGAAGVTYLEDPRLRTSTSLKMPMRIYAGKRRNRPT